MKLKRLGMELNELEKEYRINIINQLDKPYLIGFNLNLENNIITFKILKNYPFTPPIVYINNINYLDMLYFNDTYFNNKLNSIGIKCLCCQTKLCPNNWGPSMRIKDIITEYQNNKKIICKIKNHKYLNLINSSNDFILPPEIIGKISEFME